jgi:hypothetical protein
MDLMESLLVTKQQLAVVQTQITLLERKAALQITRNELALKKQKQKEEELLIWIGRLEAATLELEM